MFKNEWLSTDVAESYVGSFEVDWGQPPTSINVSVHVESPEPTENYWIPFRYTMAKAEMDIQQDIAFLQTSIQTLPGTENLAETMDDMVYFRNNLFNAFAFPTEFKDEKRMARNYQS